MNLLFVEPFNGGSHAHWIAEYQVRSSHNVRPLTLSGHHWKWRMHGGAVTLARRLREDKPKIDLVVASDMLDLTTFLALARNELAGVPVALYFHENQLTYPWSPDDVDPAKGRDAHYAFINVSSALAADHLLFNSAYHLEAFFEAFPGFLKGFPDHQELGMVDQLRQRAQVLPVGVDLLRLNRIPLPGVCREEPPVILWSHRWENDKNPKTFFELMYLLADENLDFTIALLGESFDGSHPEFRRAQNRLKDRIIQYGKPAIGESSGYLYWLKRADILPVTSFHDTFGISVIEAIASGVYPLLPKRLAYPEHIPIDRHDEFFCASDTDLLDRLRDLLQHPERFRQWKASGEGWSFVERYDWTNLAPVYDNLFAQMVSGEAS